VTPLPVVARTLGLVPALMYHLVIEPHGVAAIDSLARLLIAPFRTLIVHRTTIEAFVRRDIQGRYVSSVMGFSWAVIQPLALLVLYTFVFSHVLKVRLGGSGTTASFALYLFCGMLPWLAFSEGVTRSASVILDQTPLIKKVVFPSEILPAYTVISAHVMEFVGLGILLVSVSLFDRGPSWTLLLLPAVILLQFLFTMGVGWLLASLNVFLRDIRQLLGLVLTLWMFLTPIFYPADMMPLRFRWVLELNPMYYVIAAYRDVILEGRLPLAPQLLVLTVMAMTSFVIGHWFFRRSRHAFVDVL
jgi:lipopolysaccharide transport system permease protein